MFNVTSCHVERTQDDNYLISWSGPQAGKNVAIYMSDDPNYFYMSKNIGEPILQTNKHEVLVPNPDTGVRHYFYLHAETGEGIVLAERQLSLQGAPNFRDFGGYEAGEGRHLKWGRLYRSGKLSSLTELDIRFINRLGVSLVCDFRKDTERELEPTQLGYDNALTYAGLPVTPGSSNSFMENLQNGIIAMDDAHGFMEEINRDFVTNQMSQYAEMFRLLLAGDRQVLIHCTSGKDRTGFGAALILQVLGVSEETIVHDYLLTNRYLPVEKEIARLSNEFTDHSGAAVSEDVLRSLIEVRPEYISAGFDEIKKRFESHEHFHEEALNLDKFMLEELRDRYLH